MPEHSTDQIASMESSSQLSLDLRRLSSRLNQEFPSHSNPNAFHCSRPSDWRRSVDRLVEEVGQNPDVLILLSFELGDQAFDYLFALQKSLPTLAVDQLSEGAQQAFWKAAVHQPSIAFAWACSEVDICTAIQNEGQTLETLASNSRIAFEQERTNGRLSRRKAHIRNNQEVIRNHYAYLRLQGKGTAEERSAMVRAEKSFFKDPKEIAALSDEDFLVAAENLDISEQPWMDFVTLLNGAPRAVIERFLPLWREHNDSPFVFFNDETVLVDLLYIGGFPPHYDLSEGEVKEYESTVSQFEGNAYEAFIQHMSRKSSRIFFSNLGKFLDFARQYIDPTGYVNDKNFEIKLKNAASMSFFNYLTNLEDAEDEVLKRIFDVFGLDPFINYVWSGAEIEIYQGFAALFELVQLDPRLPEHLSKRYGIQIFSRYPAESLQKQVELESDPPSKYVLYFVDQLDKSPEGGAGYDRLILPNIPVVVCEFRRTFTSGARPLVRVLKSYGAPECVVAYSHGTETSTAELTKDDVLTKKGIQALIERLCPEGSTLILNSCSTGKNKDGIAAAISEFAGGTVIAYQENAGPDVYYSVNDRAFHLTTFGDGMVQLPMASFVDGKMMEVRNGFTVPFQI